MRLAFVALAALLLAPAAREAPARGTLVFVGARVTRAAGLVVYDADGTHPNRLVSAGIGDVVVAADGAIAYARQDPTRNEDDAVLRDARGSRTLGRGQPVGFSPDGTTLAVRPPSGGIDLYDRASGRARLSLPATDTYLGWAGGGLLYEAGLAGRSELRILALTERTIDSTTTATVVAASPDGRWIAVATNTTAYLVRADGTAGPSASQGCMGRLAWSPDSSRVACAWADGSILLLSVDGSLQTLPAHAAPTSPLSWSPGGADLAYATDDGVDVITLGTGVPRELAKGARWPQWSPDGRMLSVVFGEGASVGIVAATGGAMRVVARDASSLWLPDGRLLAEVSRHDVQQIATMRPDGHGLRFVPGATPATHPALSPDGSKIAYETLSDGPSSVVVSDLGGTRRRVVARVGTGVSDVAWSPDGRRIACVADDGIELVPASGGRAWLVPHTGGAANVAWSPDGRQLAFAVYADTTEIDVVGVDGRQRRVVVGRHRPLWTDSGIAWSPDGRKIAFALDYLLDNGFDIPGLAVVDVGTRHIRALGNELENPAWSPDSRTIAADWYGEDIDLVDVAKTGQRTIGIGADPSWSPVG